MTKFFILTFLLLSSACIYMPTSTVKTEELRPSLTFIGGDKKAEVFVNNIKIGKVGDFLKKNGKAVFVEEGVAQIKIVLNNKTIFSEKIFVSGNETKEINIK